MTSQCLGWYILPMFCSTSVTHNIAMNNTRAHVNRHSDAVAFCDITADGVLNKTCTAIIWLIKLRSF